VPPQGNFQGTAKEETTQLGERALDGAKAERLWPGTPVFV